VDEEPTTETKKRSPALAIIAVCAVLLVVIAGAALYMANDSKNDEEIEDKMECIGESINRAGSDLPELDC